MSGPRDIVRSKHSFSIVGSTSFPWIPKIEHIKKHPFQFQRHFVLWFQDEGRFSVVPPDLLLCGFKQTPTVVTCRLHAAPTDRSFLCWVWTWKCYSAGCSYGIHTNARSLGCRCSSLLLFRIVFVIKFACILAPRNPYVKKEIASKCANLQDGK